MRVAKVNGKYVLLPTEQVFAQAPPAKKDTPPLAPDAADQQRMGEVRARQEVANQQQRQIVDQAIREANRAVRTDPDRAHESLKRTLDDVLSNPDITNQAKADFANRLQRAVQSIDIQGAVVKRDQAEALNLLANANARTTLTAQERLEQDRVRERMRVFHTLMDQAREQQAYRHAQAIRRDLIDQGLPVPVAVTAGYQVGLMGYHLREELELRRIREGAGWPPCSKSSDRTSRSRMSRPSSIRRRPFGGRSPTCARRATNPPISARGCRPAASSCKNSCPSRSSSKASTIPR